MADLRNDAVNTPADDADHWLVRPATIRRLWLAFAAMLAAILLLQALVPIKGYFRLDGWPGFAAVFGFLSCVAMVLLAKALGALLKRPDDYYDA
jgi:hypothetical protein